MLSTSEGFLLGLRLRVRAHAGGLRRGAPWARCGQGLLPPSPAPGLRMAWLWLSPRVPRGGFPAVPAADSSFFFSSLKLECTFRGKARAPDTSPSASVLGRDVSIRQGGVAAASGPRFIPSEGWQLAHSPDSCSHQSGVLNVPASLQTRSCTPEPTSPPGDSSRTRARRSLPPSHPVALRFTSRPRKGRLCAFVAHKNACPTKCMSHTQMPQAPPS